MDWRAHPKEPGCIPYLRTADPETVRFEWFAQACYEYVNYERAMGTTDYIQPFDSFVQPGDLQHFCNVVSWWPKNTHPSYRAPTLADMLSYLRSPSPDHSVTFAQALEARKEKVMGWMRAQRMDPENPNETAEERKRRMTRERQRAFKLRNAEGSDDPALHTLIMKAKQEAETLSKARAWLKGELAEAKGAEAAAIAAAKAARAKRVSDAEKWVAGQEQIMLTAKAAVDAYKRA